MIIDNWQLIIDNSMWRLFGVYSWELIVDGLELFNIMKLKLNSELTVQVSDTTMVNEELKLAK